MAKPGENLTKVEYPEKVNNTRAEENNVNYGLCPELELQNPHNANKAEPPGFALLLTHST